MLKRFARLAGRIGQVLPRPWLGTAGSERFATNRDAFASAVCAGGLAVFARGRRLATGLTAPLLELPRSRRRALAIGLSVLCHALVIALLLFRPPTGLSGDGASGFSQGDGRGEDFGVDLVGRYADPLDLQTVQQTEVEDIQEAEEITAVQPLPAIDEGMMLAAPAITQNFPADAQPSDAAQVRPTGGSRAGGQGDGGSEEDGLWNAIAPCWRRLAGNGAVPVTLMLSFDPAGGLSRAPVIERPEGVPSTTQSLRSEALAIMALNECGGYKMASGRENVAVRFPAF